MYISSKTACLQWYLTVVVCVVRLGQYLHVSSSAVHAFGPINGLFSCGDVNRDFVQFRASCEGSPLRCVVVSLF